MRYIYSSAQVNLPSQLASEIISWGDDNIPKNDLFTDPNDFNFGREDEPHVTVSYGIHSQRPEDVRKLLIGVDSFEIELGKVSLFNWNSKFDVIKIDAFSNELICLNKLLSCLPSTQIYPSYKPHVTIAYIKKGRCESLVNRMDFAGKTWMPKTIVFSSKCGMKTPIPLKFKPLQMR